MDPITNAIVAALGNLGATVIKDAYNALKAVIAHRYGGDSDLAKAVENLERKPDSVGRQETLKEEVQVAKADRDPEILNVVQALLDKLDQIDQKPGSSTVIKMKARDNAIQIGQVGGDVEIGDDRGGQHGR